MNEAPVHSQHPENTTSRVVGSTAGRIKLNPKSTPCAQARDTLRPLARPKSEGMRGAGGRGKKYENRAQHDHTSPSHLPLRPHSQPRYPQRQAPPRTPRDFHHLAPPQPGLLGAFTGTNATGTRGPSSTSSSLLLLAAAVSPREEWEGAVVGELEEQQALRGVGVGVEA